MQELFSGKTKKHKKRLKARGILSVSTSFAQFEYKTKSVANMWHPQMSPERIAVLIVLLIGILACKLWLTTIGVNLWT